MVGHFFAGIARHDADEITTRAMRLHPVARQ